MSGFRFYILSTLSVFLAFVSFAQASSNILEPWLTHSEVLSTEDFKSVIDLIPIEDSEIKQMLDFAQKKAKVSSKYSLIKLFSLCDGMGTIKKGAMLTKNRYSYSFQLDESGIPIKSIKDKEFFSKSIAVKYTSRNSVHETLFVGFEKICIASNLKKIEALQYIIHELTHYAYIDYDLDSLFNFNSYHSYDDFFRNQMKRVGGEAHAYRLQTKAALRLKKKYPVLLSNYYTEYMKLFNPDNFLVKNLDDYFSYFTQNTETAISEHYYKNSLQAQFRALIDLRLRFLEYLISALSRNTEIDSTPGMQKDFEQLEKEKNNFKIKWSEYL